MAAAAAASAASAAGVILNAAAAALDPVLRLLPSPFPYKEAVVAFIVAVFVFETYLELRQKRCGAGGGGLPRSRSHSDEQ